MPNDVFTRRLSIPMLVHDQTPPELSEMKHVGCSDLLRLEETKRVGALELTQLPRGPRGGPEFLRISDCRTQDWGFHWKPIDRSCKQQRSAVDCELIYGSRQIFQFPSAMQPGVNSSSDSGLPNGHHSAGAFARETFYKMFLLRVFHMSILMLSDQMPPRSARQSV